MLKTPRLAHLSGQRHYRIIPSVYPAINFFEDLVDASEMEILWEIEGLTNDRLRQEAGNIFLVAPEDRVVGPGSSVVMAAFTHTGYPSRFTDGSYGVYYASLEQKTAISETVFHRQKFLAATQEEAGEIVMRMYEGVVKEPLHDIRSPHFAACHHEDNYVLSQQYAEQLRKNNSWGIVYHSVRDEGGKCIAAFKPRAISIPRPVSHLKYIWDGKEIVDVIKIQSLEFASASDF